MAPVPELLSGLLDTRRVLSLQRLVGNAAVTSVLDGAVAAELPEERPSATPASRVTGPESDVIMPAPHVIEPARRDGAVTDRSPESTTAAARAGREAPTAAEPMPVGVNGGAAGATPVAAGPVASGAPASPEPAPPPPPAAAPAPSPQPAALPPSAASAGDLQDRTRDLGGDPGFRAMRDRIKAAASAAKTHEAPAAAAAGAQAAARPPSNDAASQAAAWQLDVMARQQPRAFDRRAFIVAVRRAIDAAAPRTLNEVDNFKGSGGAARVKADVGGFVRSGKRQAERDIRQTTEAPPDTSKAQPKPVAPMVHDDVGPALPPVGAAGAMPRPRSAGETDLSAGPALIHAQLAEVGITDRQIARSNEPDFTAALRARDLVHAHANEAPVAYRRQEQQHLAASQAEAETLAETQLAGMRASRAEALAEALAEKTKARSADEARRAQVAGDIQAIHAATRSAVTAILDGLDAKVDAAFSEGEASAREQLEDHVAARMDAYKKQRYSGFRGALLWARDKLLGMPREVSGFYEEGRAAYLSAMDVVVERVATVVDEELAAAGARIEAGRAEVHRYVSGLSDELREIGREAESSLEGQFAQLHSQVDAEQGELVDRLAQKHVEVRDALGARFDEMRAANRGLVDNAMDAVGGVVRTVAAFRGMLLGVLRKAADVIDDIIADPIGFLRRLVDGVRSGLERFVANIGAHLQKGLTDWLFGALGAAGISMPRQLDLAGILDLVLQVLGLTYDAIRARVVGLVGEPVVRRMEQTVDVFRALAARGSAGLWAWVKDKVPDLQDLVLGRIKELVIERVIKAGVVWIISLLNPAAAFIKACKAIYDIVTWIVERGSQVMEFVSSVLESIGAIAKGNLGIVASRVEGSLAGALPLAISFLAGLLGLGGISQKVRSIIDAVRAPIGRAVNLVITGAVKRFKSLLGGAVGRAKAKYERGSAFVQGKVEAGKAWVKGRVRAGRTWARGEAEAIRDRTGGERRGAAPAGSAVAAEPEPPPLVVHETFSSDGHEHVLSSGPDGAELQLASSSVRPLRKLKDASGALDRLLRRYEAARNTYNAALNLRERSPRTRSGWTAKRKAVNAVVKDVVAWIQSYRPDNDPGRSAPGLGERRRYGQHAARISKGPAVWALEAEHVIPFAIGKELWRLAAQAVPERGSPEDREQTTITIYKGAADFKTHRHPKNDGDSIRAFRDEARGFRLPRTLRRYIEISKTARWPEARSKARDELEEDLREVRRAFDRESAAAVDRTSESIDHEHRLEQFPPKSNGARRGEEAPVPVAQDILAAATLQYQDVWRQVEATVRHVAPRGLFDRW